MVPGEEAFRFRHILIRDAAYQSIPKERRADLHEGFAAWIGRVGGDRAEEQDEIVGYHLEQAFRYREELGPLDDRARARSAGGDAARGGRFACARSLRRGSVANLLGRAPACWSPRTQPGSLSCPTSRSRLGERLTEESKAVMSEVLARAGILATPR